MSAAPAATTATSRSGTQGRWRWRLAGLALVLAYVGQDALDASWPALAALQTQDWYKYATGTGLVLYVGWLWCLFALRLGGLRGRNVGRWMARHEKSAVFAPCLLYLHSVQIGYGYLAVLGGVFLSAVAVGLASPAAFRFRSRSYLAAWLVLHVMLAALVTLLGLYHGYIALYYK